MICVTVGQGMFSYTSGVGTQGFIAAFETLSQQVSQTLALYCKTQLQKPSYQDRPKVLFTRFERYSRSLKSENIWCIYWYVVGDLLRIHISSTARAAVILNSKLTERKQTFVELDLHTGNNCTILFYPELWDQWLTDSEKNEFADQPAADIARKTIQLVHTRTQRFPRAYTILSES